MLAGTGDDEAIAFAFLHLWFHIFKVPLGQRCFYCAHGAAARAKEAAYKEAPRTDRR